MARQVFKKLGFPLGGTARIGTVGTKGKRKIASSGLGPNLERILHCVSMYCDGVNLSWRDIFQELISGEAAHAERQHIPGDLLFSLPPQSQEDTHLFHEMYAGWVFLRKFLRHLYETVANLVGGVAA